MFSRLLKAFILLYTFMVIPVLAAAAPVKDQPLETETVVTTLAPREIQGEISSISQDYISVIYSRDTEDGVEYEMLVPIQKGTKLERKKRLSDLNIGDIVKIQLEDATLENVAREKKMKRQVKTISFVGPAVKKAEPPRQPEPGDEF